MAEPIAPRSQSSPRVKVAAAFISWVVGAACIGGVFLLLHGWNDGKGYFAGAVFVGVLAFIANAVYIRATDH
jgi:hypothetical protein